MCLLPSSVPMISGENTEAKITVNNVIKNYQHFPHDSSNEEKNNFFDIFTPPPPKKKKCDHFWSLRAL